jgi:hypothetical protein
MRTRLPQNCPDENIGVDNVEAEEHLPTLVVKRRGNPEKALTFLRDLDLQPRPVVSKGVTA